MFAFFSVDLRCLVVIQTSQWTDFPIQAVIPLLEKFYYQRINSETRVPKNIS